MWLIQRKHCSSLWSMLAEETYLIIYRTTAVWWKMRPKATSSSWYLLCNTATRRMLFTGSWSQVFNAQMNIKIVDFGLSHGFTSHKLSAFCGSPSSAPEHFLGTNYDGPTVDVWNLGVVLYSLVTETLPFVGEEFWELRQWILSRQCHVPFFQVFECVKLLKKINNLWP